MSSQMVGADLAEMERLAQAFDASASRLTGLASSVRRGISISAWAGPVAGRFRLEWDSHHSRVLRHTADELRQAARHVRQQAEQQRAASSASGGRSVTPRTGDVAWSRLTAVDMGDFADAGYAGHQVPQGWRDVTGAELDRLTHGLPLHDSRTGFDARILTDGRGHYVVTFGGTDPGVSLLDGISTDEVADVQGAVGRSTQGNQAMLLATAVAGAVGTSNLMFTGHSLGGRNAALAAMSTGGRATTFDAAGVSDADLLVARRQRTGDPSYASVMTVAAGQLVVRRNPMLALLPLPSFVPDERRLGEAHVTNYANAGSALNLAQSTFGAPDALGVQVQVLDPSNPDPLEAHSIGSIQAGIEAMGVHRQHWSPSAGS